MDGFFECVERMVEFEDDHTKISKELEVYRRVARTFGFQMAKNEKHAVMLGKLLKQASPCFNFQFSISVLSLY